MISRAWADRGYSLSFETFQLPCPLSLDFIANCEPLVVRKYKSKCRSSFLGFTGDSNDWKEVENLGIGSVVGSWDCMPGSLLSIRSNCALLFFSSWDLHCMHRGRFSNDSRVLIDSRSSINNYYYGSVTWTPHRFSVGLASPSRWVCDKSVVSPHRMKAERWRTRRLQTQLASDVSSVPISGAGSSEMRYSGFYTSFRRDILGMSEVRLTCCGLDLVIWSRIRGWRSRYEREFWGGLLTLEKCRDRGWTVLGEQWRLVFWWCTQSWRDISGAWGSGSGAERRVVSGWFS